MKKVIGLFKVPKQGFDKVPEIYRQISGQEVIFYFLESLTHLDRICGDDSCEVLFIGDQILKEESEVLASFFDQKNAKIKQVVSVDQNGPLISQIPGCEHLAGVTRLSPQYVTDCLCHFLGSRNPTLGKTILSSMINGVSDIVYQSTGHKLTPGELKIQDKCERKTTDFSNVIGFFGDGVMMAMVVESDEAVLQAYLEHVLGESQSDTEIFLDAIHEISNQISGYIKKTLLDMGYRLRSTFQLGSAGHGTDIRLISVGKVFTMPFKMGDANFEVLLVITPYRRNILVDTENEEIASQKILDIRAAQVLNHCVRFVFNQFSDMPVTFISATSYETQQKKTNLVQISHGISSQGSFTLFFDLSIEVLDKLSALIFGSEDGKSHAGEMEAELNNQISGLFRTKMRDYRYFFKQLLQVGFEGEQPFSYKPTFIGTGARFSYQWDGHVFSIIFIQNSSFAHPHYDATASLAGKISESGDTAV